MITWGVFYFLV